MPALLGQHDSSRLLILGQHTDGLAVDIRFHTLTLPVHLTKLDRQSIGPLGVFCEEQLYGALDLSHASGSIDSGTEHIAHRGGRNRGTVAAAVPHEGSQARTGSIAQQRKTPGHKYPVFSLQSHHICHSTQADHVRIVPENCFLVTAEGGSQLKGNTHTGEGLVGIAAVGPVRIHNGHGLGQSFLALVVVGNHQIHAQLLAESGFFNGGDAAVHGDDERNPLFSQGMEGDGIQSVALFQAAGDIGHAVGTVFP